MAPRRKPRQVKPANEVAPAAAPSKRGKKAESPPPPEPAKKTRRGAAAAEPAQNEKPSRPSRTAKEPPAKATKPAAKEESRPTRTARNVETAAPPTPGKRQRAQSPPPAAVPAKKRQKRQDAGDSEQEAQSRSRKPPTRFRDLLEAAPSPEREKRARRPPPAPVVSPPPAKKAVAAKPKSPERKVKGRLARAKAAPPSPAKKSPAKRGASRAASSPAKQKKAAPKKAPPKKRAASRQAPVEEADEDEEMSAEEKPQRVAPRGRGKRAAVPQDESGPPKRGRAAPKKQPPPPPVVRLPFRRGLEPVGGLLFSCGSNVSGQLGLMIPDRNRPGRVKFQGDKPVVDVCAGAMHTAVIAYDGKILTCGCNDEGALGHPTPSQGDVEVEHLLQSVELTDKVIQLSCGGSHTAAVTETGKLYVWGNFKDDNGSLGLVTPEQQETLPVAALEGNTVVRVSSGADFIAALTDDGQVYTWGYGNVGQLGRPYEKESALLPQSVVAKIRRSVVKFDNMWCTEFGLYLKQKGADIIYACGLNNYSQLGLPLLPEDDESEESEDEEGTEERKKPKVQAYFNPTEVESLSHKGIVQIVGGMHHSLALDGEGKVYAWGRPEYGRLGLGQPPKPEETPESKTEEEKEKVKTTEEEAKPAGEDTSAAETSTTTEEKSAAESESLNETTDDAKPKEESAAEPAVEPTEAERLAPTPTPASVSLPVVTEPTVVPALAGKQIIEIGAAGNVSFALEKAGELYSWGMNSSQLGLDLTEGDDPDVWEPRRISGKRPVLGIAVGSGHTLMIAQDDEMAEACREFYLAQAAKAKEAEEAAKAEKERAIAEALQKEEEEKKRQREEEEAEAAAEEAETTESKDNETEEAKPDETEEEKPDEEEPMETDAANEEEEQINEASVEEIQTDESQEQERDHSPEKRARVEPPPPATEDVELIESDNDSVSYVEKNSINAPLAAEPKEQTDAITLDDDSISAVEEEPVIIDELANNGKTFVRKAGNAAQPVDVTSEDDEVEYIEETSGAPPVKTPTAEVNNVIHSSTNNGVLSPSDLNPALSTT